MQFEKGRKKTGGRPPGAVNRFTRQMRNAVLAVYDQLGGDDAFYQWARKQPGDFYRIAARLIPAEAREANSDNTVKVIYVDPRPRVVAPAETSQLTGPTEPKAV